MQNNTFRFLFALSSKAKEHSNSKHYERIFFYSTFYVYFPHNYKIEYNITNINNSVSIYVFINTQHMF